MNSFFVPFFLGLGLGIMIISIAFGVYVIDRMPTIVEDGVKAVLADYTVMIKQ